MGRAGSRGDLTGLWGSVVVGQLQQQGTAGKTNWDQYPKQSCGTENFSSHNEVNGDPSYLAVQVAIPTN